jgi:hypothetical protein
MVITSSDAHIKITAAPQELRCLTTCEPELAPLLQKPAQVQSSRAESMVTLSLTGNSYTIAHTRTDQ